jgi:hypothetical protein
LDLHEPSIYSCEVLSSQFEVIIIGRPNVNHELFDIGLYPKFCDECIIGPLFPCYFVVNYPINVKLLLELYN